MAYRVRTVDVFTQQQLAGNQLAVVLDADDLPAEVMQAIAREMNLAETTFVMAPKQDGAAARIRIFTPSTELPFAGHPTIGTAWVLMAENRVPAPAERFTLEEVVGPVAVRVEQRPDGQLVWMTHPPVSFGEVIEERAELANALGLSQDDLMPEVPIQIASTGVPFAYVALRDLPAVDRAISSGERLAHVLGARAMPPAFLFAAAGPGRRPLGAFAVRYGIVPRSQVVSLISEQGTKMKRQSFVHIELEYPPASDLPSRIEVGGGVVPVLSAELSLS